MKRATARVLVVVFRSDISIHALVKRATASYIRAPSSATDFNPRPREEGDLTASGRLTSRDYFNPRPREEGDSNTRPVSTGRGHFNPRPREEGDVWW